jgi:hypothetical protein
LTESNSKNPKPGYFHKYLRLLLNVNSPFHRNLITFLFFVLVSTGFWLVRSLGEQYETRVNYPVRFVNFPENKVLIGDLPDRLELRVRANGFSILKSRLNLNLIPLRFDISSLSLGSAESDTFMIITETVKDILSEELSQVRILDISPDTLIFRFTDIVTRKVPIQPVKALNERFFQKQFTQNGDMLVVPDSVVVSGPGNLVNRIRAIRTRPISYTNLTDSVTTDVELEPVNTLTYSDKKVTVMIPVDRFTEVEESLQVYAINVPDSLSMVAIPGKVKITYRICLSNYRNIKHNPLSAAIDYRDVSAGPSGRLSIFLADTPHIVSNIRFNPPVTEFLISRK